MKIFITGIGSDLGTHIAHLLESRRDVTAIAGIDRYPPRRYLARTEFFLARTYDSQEVADVIAKCSPDVIINFGVYEPGARLSRISAMRATQTSTQGIIHGIDKSKNKDVHVITRSSVAVYGFANSNTKDETSPLAPDSAYGEMCRDLEEQLGHEIERLTIIRTAPEIGAHVPHPLARILKLPILPVELRLPFVHDIGFPVISPIDVTDIFVKAVSFNQNNNVRKTFHGSTSTNATMAMALREGNRIPLPLIGVGFGFAKQLSYLAGAPVDEHVEMFIRRGMLVDSTATRMQLGITSQLSATEVIRNLYSAQSAYETITPRDVTL